MTSQGLDDQTYVLDAMLDPVTIVALRTDGGDRP